VEAVDGTKYKNRAIKMAQSMKPTQKRLRPIYKDDFKSNSNEIFRRSYMVAYSKTKQK
jgi:hypothetical protein